MLECCLYFGYVYVFFCKHIGQQYKHMRVCVCVYSFHFVKRFFLSVFLNIEMLIHLLCVEIVLATSLNLNLKFTLWNDLILKSTVLMNFQTFLKFFLHNVCPIRRKYFAVKFSTVPEFSGTMEFAKNPGFSKYHSSSRIELE